MDQPKRQLLHRIVPNRVSVLDLVNANADFNNFIAEHCHNVPRFHDRESMYRLLADDLASDAPVDYLEFGVWQGASLQEWARLLGDPRNRFFGFDSFQGLPEDWLPDKPKGTFGLEGAIPSFSDPRISLIDGYYQDVLYEFLTDYDRADRRLTIHIDCDLYSSTLFVLAALDRFLRPGDVLVMDEFSYLVDEFAAFADYLRAFKRDFRVRAIVGRGDKIALQLGGRRPG